MESIEQPFDSLGRFRHEETNDKLELIDEAGGPKHLTNGSSPEAENSPLHQGKSNNSILHGPQNHGLRVIIVSSIVFSVAVTVALILTIFLEPKQVHGHAAISCEDSRCSDEGLRILKAGGNAVDAAVAAAFCLAVVNPAHAGIGGGGFAIVHDHKFQKSWGYDFRSQAPAASSPAMISQPNAQTSMQSVGIPGFVKGLAHIHNKHGSLPWDDLIESSIDLAQYGVSVSKELALILEESFQGGSKLSEELRSIFLNVDGSPKTVNDTYTLEALAQSLTALRDNSDSLYTGSLRDSFVNEMSDLGGVITADDMGGYQVKTMDIISSKLKALTVLGLPPPAGGVLVALMLNMVDKLGWKKQQANDSLMYHQLIETYKFGYASRPFLGDPSSEANMGTVVAQLLDAEYAAKLVARIDNNQTYSDPAHYSSALTATAADQGTSQISVIDSSELMVTLTVSIRDKFGNKQMLPTTGIILNNELMDFDQNQSLPNGLEPGKRPHSSMAPTVIFNEEHPCNHRIITGAQGGMKITTGVVETVVNSVMFLKNISNSVSAPRVHNQLIPEETYYEGLSQSIITDLQAKGHVLTPWPATELSKVMAVEKTNDDVHAYADYRSGGAAAQFK